ncbi:PTS lactose/cellobiose transporter subunit IIA (plasmid) [Borreliella yangtzensis]|uniref:PTS system cellobiose-specific IIA component n=1 Tax=Borreliella yangtzensis TaxID=683292 RepID=A0ABR6PAU7_9SPIR|nr:PTS lactose/cellobiose transporter subunit IIA [Borreliella yangtzensis]MBB6043397.1 PTS system cellobiose-specific IIA component [Borreliella yangtzensis]WKC72913.1 PTS lactose/cellobiose transporter subunit IIA [Borreliella yangtzensis]WKC73831.1 PTS lactose/cellobiose transporter subunit IIA [Borreliella yangtzensis]
MNKKIYSIEELIDNISMPVVAYSGEAKSFLREALEHAKNKDYEKAELAIQESKNSISKAHETHREIIQQSTTNPNSIKIPFILIHAEDHLMSAISELSIFEELINVYKIINEIKK